MAMTLTNTKRFDWLTPKEQEVVEDGTLVIRVEMPDLDPQQDIDVTISGRVLRIAVERRESTTSEDEGTTRSEYTYGAYTRTIELPEGTTEDDVKASYVDGVLEVRLPVSDEEPTSHRVPVATAPS